MALVALIFCLSLNSISSFEVLNARLNHTSDIYHSASHLQGLLYQQRNQLNNATVPHQHNAVMAYLRGNPYQQEPHSHTTAIAHLQANDVHNNQLIQQNRSRLQGNKYQPQRGLRSTTTAQSQIYLIDNRIVHPRFRPLPQSPLLGSTAIPSKMNYQDNNQLNRPLLADEKANINTKNSSGLLQVLTTKIIDKSAQTRRPFSFADYYYQQHLRAFFDHKHDEVSPHTHSNIKTGLRR